MNYLAILPLMLTCSVSAQQPAKPKPVEWTPELTTQVKQITSVQPLPDGNLVVAVNGDGKAHLWRAPTWAEIEAEEKQQGSYGPGR